MTVAATYGVAALVGAGRRPATEPVLAAAWRRALAADPGLFGPVAEQPATVRAMVAAHRNLREVDEAGLSAISADGGPVAADLVRLHRQVVATLASGWYDVVDLRRAAVEALRQRPRRAAEIGAVVLFLPQELPPGALALLAELAAGGGLHTVAGLTGEARADAAVRRGIAQLHAADLPSTPPPATATRMLHGLRRRRRGPLRDPAADHVAAVHPCPPGRGAVRLPPARTRGCSPSTLTRDVEIGRR